MKIALSGERKKKEKIGGRFADFNKFLKHKNDFFLTVNIVSYTQIGIIDIVNTVYKESVSFKFILYILKWTTDTSLKGGLN